MLFILFQLIRFVSTLSIPPILLTALDTIIAWIIWREYDARIRRQDRRLIDRLI